MANTTTTPTTTNAKDAAPLYRLIAPFYVGEKYYQTGQHIAWDGVPGKNMVPLNDAAKAVVKKHQDAKDQASGKDSSKLTAEQKRMLDPENQPVAREAYTVAGEHPAGYVPQQQFNPSVPSQPHMDLSAALPDGQTGINGLDTNEERTAAFPGLSTEEALAAKKKADDDSAKASADADKKAKDDAAKAAATPATTPAAAPTAAANTKS